MHIVPNLPVQNLSSIRSFLKTRQSRTVSVVNAGVSVTCDQQLTYQTREFLRCSNLSTFTWKCHAPSYFGMNFFTTGNAKTRKTWMSCTWWQGISAHPATSSPRVFRTSGFLSHPETAPFVSGHSPTIKEDPQRSCSTQDFLELPWWLCRDGMPVEHWRCWICMYYVSSKKV